MVEENIQRDTEEEKAIEGFVFDIQRFCVHDGPGIRTVIFTKGCSLRCKWCSNPESQIGQQELMFYLRKCNFCGYCIEICPENALKRDDEKYGIFIDKDKCTLCGKCIDVCNPRALMITGRL